MIASVFALCEHLVDYAGLFPPAALPMRDAVTRYASYRVGTRAWMLGRFVLPAARLGEFADAADVVLGGAHEPWRLSVVAGDDAEGAVAAMAAFNASHRGALCDTIETRASTPDAVGAIARAVRAAGVVTFVEIPLADDPAPLVAAIGAHGLAAKLRTGGTTADAFPAPRDVVRACAACVRAHVPFKATAGLHHPLRGEYPLTYAANAPRGAMYGFLNVFLATALLRDGGTDDDAEALLIERDRAAIVVADGGIRWRGRLLLTARIAQLRTRAATSFGSCSFDEPVEDLVALGLL